MNKRDIEDMFSMDIEEMSNLDNVDELLNLGKQLSLNDFSKESNKEDVFNKTLENINKLKGDNNMKKPNRLRRFTTIAASMSAVAILTCSFAQTAFGQSIVENIVKKVSLGNIEAMQVEPFKGEHPVPKELEGKVLDKDGNKVETYSNKNKGKYFTASGEEIDYIVNGEIITVAESQKEREEEEAKKVTVKDQKELNNYTSFNVTIPTYIPEGYEFDRAELYKENIKDEAKNLNHVGLYYKNKKTGKEMYVGQTKDDKNSLYGISTEGKLEKGKVNGSDAIIYDDKVIQWKANNSIYSVNCDRAEDVTKDQVLKIAESIK